MKITLADPRDLQEEEKKATFETPHLRNLRDEKLFFISSGKFSVKNRERRIFSASFPSPVAGIISKALVCLKFGAERHIEAKLFSFKRQFPFIAYSERR